MARYADLDPTELRRACTLAQLPGVTRREAASRFGLSVGALRRALREHGQASRPSRADLVLHAMTDAGTRTEGALEGFAQIASYLDFVNKDGSRAEDVRALVEELSEQGWLVLEGPVAGGRWTLARPWP